ncbi:hypothetical protein BDZ89DRAFT_1227742 [Hymenopellis radicata]|nr:hypothetical protein BDZ89DRAFT_1227742 [Hymenopellis radicata]
MRVASSAGSAVSTDLLGLLATTWGGYEMVSGKMHSCTRLCRSVGLGLVIDGAVQSCPASVAFLYPLKARVALYERAPSHPRRLRYLPCVDNQGVG